MAGNAGGNRRVFADGTPYNGRRILMKVRTSLRSLARKPGAKVVRRRNRVLVLNRKNPRWSGRQG
ncbi:hypothetical protein Asi02nite_76600 [Asanoa siamensis]|uniref:Large ribosomal subunit protein bL36 n=1 Tax=Asanoa siamensis TaxID=926357 RepID=A0ABQ4D4V3_9ACTN|nr:hypothetical protein Asi02nite_76600 [Asanoa siamensis]